GEELQDRLEPLVRRRRRWREQEDLGVEDLEGPLELLLAPHFDRAVQSERERPMVPLLLADLLPLLAAEREDHSIRHLGGTLEIGLGPPEDRQPRRLPHRSEKH